MMSVDCKLHDETSANTPRFSYPTRRDVFIAALPTGLQISNKKQGGALNLKGLSQDGERLNLTENLRASPFNKELFRLFF